MPAGRRRQNTKAHNSHKDGDMARKIDDLIAFEKFKEEVLPVLEKDISKGLTAEELVQKYHALAMARGISIAISPKSQDSVALSAIKDILDRAMGKPKERSEITHKMKDVPEEQLNAVLLAKMKALNLVSDSEETSSDDDDRGSLQ